MNTTFLSVIYFIAFSHALMLALALWRRSGANEAGRLLAVLMAIIGYKVFEGGASHSGLYRSVPHLLDLMPAMVMILGPLFYGYVRKITGKPAFTTKDWILHLSPWLLFFMLYNTGYVFRSAELKIAMWDSIAAHTGGAASLPGEVVMRLITIKIHLSIYLFFSWRSLTLFAGSVYDLRADNSADIVRQLRYLTVAFILLEAVWVVLFLGQQYLGIGTLTQVGQVWLLFIAGIVFAMGFAGLQNPSLIFTNEERILSAASATDADTTATVDEPAEAKIKYIHSALSDTASDEIAQLIEQTLDTGQLYLNERLTLTDLAKALNMKPHLISQVINQHMKTNFYKLINGFRVQHAVSLLDDTNNSWPIERIALESGFGNRVTFNKAFKEQMQSTASDYRKRSRKAS